LGRLKIIGYRVMVRPSDPLPLLKCFLEDGRSFNMSSIPVDAAIAIERLANGVELSGDPRLSLPMILMEIPSVESDIRGSVKEVVIDDMLESEGGYVYCASVFLEIDGKILKKLMVPSSAIILALLSGADVYVDEKFLSSESF